MVKKIVRDFFILFGLLVLVVSTNRSLMGYLVAKRDHDEWWGFYQRKNGDLVDMSYLDIPKFHLHKDLSIKRPPHNYNSKIALYLLGASNTFFLRDTSFVPINSYMYIPRTEGSGHHFRLDSTKTNILILEIAERYFRDYFHDTRVYDDVCDSTKANKTTLIAPGQEQHRTEFAGLLPDLKDGVLFNPFINQNLQFNLFNYNFIMPMFISKATMNYRFFNRASGDVVISNDRKFLFLKETVAKDGWPSSYSYYDQNEQDHYIKTLNEIYDHYRAQGFREIYLTIIPSSATIMQPEGYNNLIPLIQNDKRNKMQMIDVYSVFKSHPETLYFNPGDTHWNTAGIQEWLKIVNNMLDSWNIKDGEK